MKQSRQWMPGVLAALGAIAVLAPIGQCKTPAKKPAKPSAKMVKLASGLMLQDLKVGKGAAAKAGDHVTVHYRGTLTNGKQFDASYDRGQPFDFDLGAGQVIKGWDQGVAGMKVGGKRKLVIPSSLGYGVRGAGADIPPNATLVFVVELLKIN
jgi:FKBP-type peptidyl-prolyl cis-trans isomerase